MSTDEQPLGRGVLILAALVTAALVGALTLTVILWPRGGDDGATDGDALTLEDPGTSETESDGGADVEEPTTQAPEQETEEETGTGLRDLTDSALDEAERLRERADEEARELRDRAEEEARSRFSDPLDTLRELFGRGDAEEDDAEDATPSGPGGDEDEDDRDRGRDRGEDHSDDDERRDADRGERDGNGNGNGNGNGEGRGGEGEGDDAPEDDRSILDELIDGARDYFRP
ncbi:hypothetical protein ACPYO6_04630 [Georgenia sp. Z1344]|uniref:hypothetical protein n=1 Tax=Georgenia sp. Z1344 TaxID=3416706 RepID=UPI003CF34AC3